MNSRERSVELYRESGATSRVVDARIGADGTFVIETQDIGEAAEQFWGDSDYEFWVMVAAADKVSLLDALIADQLPPGVDRGPMEAFLASRAYANTDVDAAILALIQQKYQGDSGATDRFRELCGRHHVPYEGGSWA